ncbi:MAG: hypothetical protein HQ553_11850 [Chloroflexi bacterium]|nr:hypothetical protein [Chloroflexota bacterium]
MIWRKGDIPLARYDKCRDLDIFEITGGVKMEDTFNVLKDSIYRYSAIALIEYLKV